MSVPPLRPDQGRFCDSILDRCRCAQFILGPAPTRMGKTVVSGHIAERRVAKGNLPTFFGAWSRTVHAKTYDDFVKWGLPAARLASGHDLDLSQPVQVAMAQTLESRWNDGLGDAIAASLPNALWILDEAHADHYGWLLPKLERLACKVIGLTATPIDERGCGLGRIGTGAGYDAMATGPTYAELRGIGTLVPITVYRPPGEDVYASFAGDPKKLQQWGVNVLEQVEPVGDPVEEYLRVAKGRTFVYFTEGTRAAKLLAERFTAAGIPCRHVTGKTPESEREEILERLRTGRILGVTNDSVFTTGWDCPPVSCVGFDRGVRSFRLWRQAGNRASGFFAGNEFMDGKRDAVVIDHGGAALAFGPPDDDIEWTLDPKARHGERKLKERAKQIAQGEIEPRSCPKCGAWRERGPRCPKCGHESLASLGYSNLAGRLEELTRERPTKSDQQVRQAAWASILFSVATTGGRFNQAFARYRSQFNTSPQQDGCSPMPADELQMSQRVADVFPKFNRKRKAVPA